MTHIRQDSLAARISRWREQREWPPRQIACDPKGHHNPPDGPCPFSTDSQAKWQRFSTDPAEDFNRDSHAGQRQQNHPKRIQAKCFADPSMEGRASRPGHATARAIQPCELMKRATWEPWQAGRPKLIEKKRGAGQQEPPNSHPQCAVAVHRGNHLEKLPERLENTAEDPTSSNQSTISTNHIPAAIMHQVLALEDAANAPWMSPRAFSPSTFAA